MKSPSMLIENLAVNKNIHFYLFYTISVNFNYIKKQCYAVKVPETHIVRPIKIFYFDLTFDEANIFG